MARNGESVCRLCRVEKTKLFLKGNKCLTEKCPAERRTYPPGQHGRLRKRIRGYGIQLREKQKLKRYYGMSESQFRLFFKRAEQKKGITGENLLIMLERRLDNVIFLAGFSRSRRHARLMITQRHFLVNGRKVASPSFQVDSGDVVEVKPKTIGNESMKETAGAGRNKTVPGWLEVNWDEMKGRVLSLPTRQDITLPVSEHLVVEFYSK